MKIGDVVKDVYPNRRGFGWKERFGVIVKEVFHPLCGVTSSNKVFDILWQDGTIGHNVWNYDLELISESR